LAFGWSLRWYALWPWNQYNEPSFAQPARQLKHKPMGGFMIASFLKIHFKKPFFGGLTATDRQIY